MGHDISTASSFRASSLFQKYEADALRAVVEASAIGADDITDLVLVNMKGPDYASHAHGPRSKEMRETLAELDRQMAAYIAVIERKAGAGRSVTVITADHGMPDEPPPGGRRYYLDEIIAALNQQFDPKGGIIQYYNDAANNQIHMDTARLRSRGFSLADVARFLERDLFAAAFTEDEVRAAQERLK
jgi:predicted AlkP superfamily pyrophosphatase or phosphodiesterase